MDWRRFLLNMDGRFLSLLQNAVPGLCTRRRVENGYWPSSSSFSSSSSINHSIHPGFRSAPTHQLLRTNYLLSLHSLSPQAGTISSCHLHGMSVLKLDNLPEPFFPISRNPFGIFIPGDAGAEIQALHPDPHITSYPQPVNSDH